MVVFWPDIWRWTPSSSTLSNSELVAALRLELLSRLDAQRLFAMGSKLWAFVFTASSLLFQPGSTRKPNLDWHPPVQTSVNNLTHVLGDSGVYGFIYDTSETPDDRYGTYNWCNMPHARKTEYVKPSSDYELVYVELMQRHHKRTPYSSNAFPVESYHWDCDDQGLYYFGRPFEGHDASEGYWKGYTSSVNPFVPSGWIGTCQFPQITASGLDDSWQHGRDLYGVYHDLLGLLPGRDEDWRSRVVYRVTTNVITSQVAGMLINGMWGATDSVPLLVQAAAVDSLEPKYSCPKSSSLFDRIQSSENQAWETHLEAARSLYASLDDISGVSPDDSGFHASLDHYYDNLSARQCHQKPLPCKLVNGVNSSTCVTQRLADEVYRLGHWEYSQVYRDSPDSLAASAASLGVWVAELAAHIREAVAGGTPPSTLYFHNVAHDGSISRLLSVLQVETMVWPGMGSEVIFEVWREKGERGEAGPRSTSTRGAYYVRVLFGGRTLKSSNPSLGVMEMVPVDVLLAYFDGLVGVDASLVKEKCAA